MTNSNLQSIQKKLAGMIKRLDLLKAYQALTLDEYVQDEITQAVVERFLELIIQGAIDTNKMLLKQALKVRQDEDFTNAEAFILAGENGLISQELAERLSASGRFRNVLAHLYDDILPERTYDALQKALVDYPQYIHEITTYLNQDRNRL